MPKPGTSRSSGPVSPARRYLTRPLPGQSQNNASGGWSCARGYKVEVEACVRLAPMRGRRCLRLEQHLPGKQRDNGCTTEPRRGTPVCMNAIGGGMSERALARMGVTEEWNGEQTGGTDDATSSLKRKGINSPEPGLSAPEKLGCKFCESCLPAAALAKFAVSQFLVSLQVGGLNLIGTGKRCGHGAFGQPQE
jgi:hypothetical protein